jgi:hypothetical protein
MRCLIDTRVNNKSIAFKKWKTVFVQSMLSTLGFVHCRCAVTQPSKRKMIHCPNFEIRFDAAMVIVQHLKSRHEHAFYQPLIGTARAGIAARPLFFLDLELAFKLPHLTETTRALFKMQNDAKRG